MTELDSRLSELADVREAARVLALTDPNIVAAGLQTLADRLTEQTPMLLAANALDLERMDPSDPKYDRLRLTEQRVQAIAQDVRSVAALPSPLGEVLEQRRLENGLELTKLRVPIGVVAVVFESRPNVAVDVATLCLRSGNAAVLKGSRDAVHSNRALLEVIQESLGAHDLPSYAVWLAPPERDAVAPLLAATESVDLAIPRGSQGLIDYVRDVAKVPTIETGAGIVHAYVDRSADLDIARAIVTNSKTRRVSVCNALDTLLVHQDLLSVLPELMADLGQTHQVEVFADDRAYKVLQEAYQGPLKRATPAHFGQEFLALKMSVKVVATIDQALVHIARYSSRHSETIVAEDPATLSHYLAAVDAAAVYANASTAFTDGSQFGMGAEIGISTQKLHARGPMALPELTSYKWVVRGSGQIRST